jgi:hypothetical protein
MQCHDVPGMQKIKSPMPSWHMDEPAVWISWLLKRLRAEKPHLGDLIN